MLKLKPYKQAARSQQQLKQKKQDRNLFLANVEQVKQHLKTTKVKFKMWQQTVKKEKKLVKQELMDLNKPQQADKNSNNKQTIVLLTLQAVQLISNLQQQPKLQLFCLHKMNKFQKMKHLNRKVANKQD